VIAIARGPLRLTRAGALPTLTPPGPGTIDFALRHIRGGKRDVMDYARSAVAFEPRLAPVLTMWEQLTPWQRRKVTLDALVTQVGDLAPGEFVGAVARAAFELTGGVTDLIVTAALPELIVTVVKQARTLNGYQDRRVLLEHAGFLPTRQPVAVQLRDPDRTTLDAEPGVPAFMQLLPADRPTEK